MLARKIMSVSDNVRYVYQADDYQPIWVKENYMPTEAAEHMLAELEEVRWDGLDPEKYNLSALRKLKTILDTTKKNSVVNAIAFDTLLTRSYFAVSRQLLLGTVAPKKVDSLWFHVNDTAWNAPQQLLALKGKYPSLDDYRSSVPTYKLLRNEYKLYYTLAADSDFLQAQAAIEPKRHLDSAALGNINYVIRAELPWLQVVPNDTMSEQAQLITNYQYYIGSKVTGKFDSSVFAALRTSPDSVLRKISVNMERVRWMQRDFGNMYVFVDIPLMELFLRKDGENKMHMRVVVGRPERQTPSLFASMANIVINPSWGVPPTILKNDVVPGFQKSGRSYLAKKGLRPYDKKGNPVNISQLNMGNLKKYTYKQAPGDDNSLGFVKFNLPNPWDIYLHDTPHRDDFGKRYRALSSGCIRLHQPQELALYILSQLEKLRYTQGRLDTIISTHKSRWEILKNKIPVHIAYLTAFEDSTGSHIRYLGDIYQRDGKLMSALN